MLISSTMAKLYVIEDSGDRKIHVTMRTRKLKKDCDEQKVNGTKLRYRRLKSVHRTPPDAARQVLNALEKLGWAYNIALIG